MSRIRAREKPPSATCKGEEERGEGEMAQADLRRLGRSDLPDELAKKGERGRKKKRAPALCFISPSPPT